MSSEVLYALDQANKIVAFMNEYPSTFREGDENNGQALMFMFALFKCQEIARLRNETSEILLKDVIRYMIRHRLFFETRGLIVEVDGSYQIRRGKTLVFYKKGNSTIITDPSKSDGEKAIMILERISPNVLGKNRYHTLAHRVIRCLNPDRKRCERRYTLVNLCQTHQISKKEIRAYCRGKWGSLWYEENKEERKMEARRVIGER
tara:strand:- start:562 stop:1176 length:615 start_codon:yes stop_codon:yes gene_type:complete